MIVAHVDFKVAEADREKVLEVLLDQVPTVRSMPGCNRFVPFQDTTRDGGIGVMHEWTDRPAFDAYLASASFQESGKVIRPLMLVPPVSKRFEVVEIETRE